MTDRPILFSAPMVRALLAGTKMQTRRVLKPLPRRTIFFDPKTAGKDQFQGPRIQPGDRLWVRETGNWRGPMKNQIGAGSISFTFYAADSARGRSEFFDDKNKPGIFMPRWASRLTLYVTDVRVERLNSISEADARAEGVVQRPDGWFTVIDAQRGLTGAATHAVDAYAMLWDSINGLGSWAQNPWVAAYTFAVRAGNIDSLPATLEEAA